MQTNAARPIVPESALVDDAGRPIVFVQREGETFERRAVTLGARAGNIVQVLDGVKSGDRVVTRGAFLVRLASLSTQVRRTATCIDMIDALIRWSLHHRPVVLATAAAFLAWGVWTTARMPLDVLPDLTAPTVTILAEVRAWTRSRSNRWSPSLSNPRSTARPAAASAIGHCGRGGRRVGRVQWGQDIMRARQTVTEKLTLVSERVACQCRAAVSRAGLVDHGARCCSSISNRSGTRPFADNRGHRHTAGCSRSPASRR